MLPPVGPLPLNVTLCVTPAKIQFTVPLTAMSIVAGVKLFVAVAFTSTFDGNTAAAFTVIVAVPLMAPDDAVMWALPAATPDTNPLLLTVATAVASDAHVNTPVIALPF